jgi:hypothetical protein
MIPISVRPGMNEVGWYEFKNVLKVEKEGRDHEVKLTLYVKIKWISVFQMHIM